MIKLQDYTPDVYYKESRDFQFIGRLFDLILNSVKTEADLIYNIPVSDNSNDRLLELLALTLGFKVNHHYNSKQLRAICKVFPEILKNKGSIQAVIVACNALFNAEGLDQALDYDFTKNPNNDKTELNLYIPQEFGDITLINDLLTYVLPAGMSCNLIRELRINVDSMTEVAVEHIFKLYKHDDPSNIGTQTILYDNNILAKIPTFNHYRNPDTGEEVTFEVEPGILTLDTGKAFKNLVEDNVGFVANGIIYKPKNNN